MNVLLNQAQRCLVATSLLAVAAAVGCGAPEAEFRLNRVYAAVEESRNNVTFTEPQMQNVNDVVTALFGTPDSPIVPNLPDVDLVSVLDQRKLDLAAGPVHRESIDSPTGLYREHCVHCHGITGDGAGPTAAFLNPYPRDYRRGIFKFKSTPNLTPPTDDDLHRTLFEGLPGTSMPSFKLLPRNELESLVHYVRYLAIRGEVERQFIYGLVTELDEGELLIDFSVAGEEQYDFVRSEAALIVQKWIDAEAAATPVPARPEMPMEESIAKGKELFFGPVANCVKCHGPTGIGDGVTNDYDEWTKELNPANKEPLQRFLSLGALAPRNSRPRNLRMDVYRGGRRPVDLYWRIHNGIAGTPMPAAAMKPDGAPENDTRLTPKDIWSLIDYIRHLPYEPLSKPANLQQPTNNRERL